jgi:ribosome-associated protein
MSALTVTPSISIPEDELEERFVRASGPGGQNVNKVATAVELRFDAARSTVLSDDALTRLRMIAGTKMTADGVLVIDARRHRTQAQNREDARERLAELVRQALVRPRKRRKTRPTKGSVEKRIESKKRRSETKRGRGRIATEETRQKH